MLHLLLKARTIGTEKVQMRRLTRKGDRFNLVGELNKSPKQRQKERPSLVIRSCGGHRNMHFCLFVSKLQDLRLVMSVDNNGSTTACSANRI